MMRKRHVQSLILIRIPVPMLWIAFGLHLDLGLSRSSYGKAILCPGPVYLRLIKNQWPWHLEMKGERRALEDQGWTFLGRRRVAKVVTRLTLMIDQNDVFSMVEGNVMFWRVYAGSNSNLRLRLGLYFHLNFGAVERLVMGGREEGL